MNPHFIFNSLSAIQSYIIQQNVDKADRLISNFAKLMRKILTDSVKANLSLQEEKDLLESYLLTESLRFENKINFEISIAEDLDPDGVFIPTMIVQPFVENAIVHGLKRKNGQGKIKVNFSQNNGMLEVVVEDDGDGFIKKESANTHQSKAIEITQRRLALLPNSGKESASLKSFNLADKDPSRSGFRIEMRLPLAYKAR
jgi:sensor histidine kinase YesM